MKEDLMGWLRGEMEARDKRSPSPRPSPPGEGDPFVAVESYRGAVDSGGDQAFELSGFAVPSPGGEGQGEGGTGTDVDLRSAAFRPLPRPPVQRVPKRPKGRAPGDRRLCGAALFSGQPLRPICP